MARKWFYPWVYNVLKVIIQYDGRKLRGKKTQEAIYQMALDIARCEKMEYEYLINDLWYKDEEKHWELIDQDTAPTICQFIVSMWNTMDDEQTKNQKEWVDRDKSIRECLTIAKQLNDSSEVKRYRQEIIDSTNKYIEENSSVTKKLCTVV